MKGKVIADHLADNEIEDYKPLKFDFPYEDVLIVDEEKASDWWTMYFDKVVNMYGNKVGAMIISLNKNQYLVSIKIQFECTNNTAKYKACILGLEATLE